MKISDKGIELIKKFEGFRKDAYKCQAGIWTIGYGTTKYNDNTEVKKGDEVSIEEATELFKNDIVWAEDTVNEKVKVEINQNMFDALVSFVYNLGTSVFVETRCTLLRKLNAKDYTGASNEFKRWNRANGMVSKGLTKRRMGEGNLFISL